MIEEDEEHFDPLLDNVGMATPMEEDVDSESRSQNVLRGVDVQDPSLRMTELWRHGKDQGPHAGAAQNSGYSRHEQTVFITTVYGLTYYGRES